MIAGLYAAILAFLYVGLTIHVIRGRFKHHVSLGDGGNPDLEKRIRMHGNFAEFAPISLLLLFVIEYVDYNPIVVHILGLMLLAARIFHAWGISSGNKARQAGMALTMFMLILSASLLLVDFIANSAMLIPQ